jgi:hypothetical protein
LIEPIRTNDKSHRTGRNVHEIRDVFRTLWAKSPAKPEVAEFMMGHSVDPLEYDKSFRDEAFFRGEYLKALPWLNIMSSGRPYNMVEEESVENLRLEVERLRKYEDVVGNLRELVFKLQGRIEQMEKGPKLSV